ncbi:hypothetical protein [Burkholderia multivorans]|uniref:hypothetical protein n=1 Tax=Burkholderia multivorans TaxID=87883 RepID=UPI0012D89918|nr:hypothetical protein [Burkholderia multivorans]MBU9387058.1 hypothetical protein [Burkholderia multivorans]MBY4792556.1 hypothetical protein [Burkholderia multivorans]
MTTDSGKTRRFFADFGRFYCRAEDEGGAVRANMRDMEARDAIAVRSRARP